MGLPARDYPLRPLLPNPSPPSEPSPPWNPMAPLPHGDDGMDGLDGMEANVARQLQGLGFRDAAAVVRLYGPIAVHTVVREVLADPSAERPGGLIRWRLRKRFGA